MKGTNTLSIEEEEIYQQQLRDISTREDLDQVAANLPTLPSLKSSLYRLRRKRLPAMPTTRGEVHFCGEWAETDAGENFLLVEDGQGDDKIIIFATQYNLELLSQAEKIYVDGTFQICPRLFYQIFSLHAFKNGRQFPLVYCLLPGKSRAVYLRALEIIKQKSEDLGYTLAPAEVLTDFELAIIQAVELTFPTTEVKGCFFHFAQALNRKIATLGLQCAYRQNPDVSKFVRKTVALAFVPQRFVRIAWHGIKIQVPNVEKMDEFVTYFEETWLVGNFGPRL